MNMEDRIEPDEHLEKTPPDMGLARVGRAFGYSVAGLACAWRNEAAFRQEALAAAVLIPLACLLPIPLLQCALLVASVLMVLALELLNSSIESAIDRISMEPHPLSKRAKDMGSAAVLLALLVAFVVWAAIVGGWLFDLRMS
jgi:diacylglycerol kinase (ATP)